MAYKITKDHIGDGGKPEWNREGRLVGDEALCTIPFKLYDDDGNLYYEGLANELGLEDAFEFGMWDAGCTRIDAPLPGPEFTTYMG